MNKILFNVILYIFLSGTINTYAQDATTTPPASNAISLTGLEGLATFSEKTTQTHGSFWGLEGGYQFSMLNNTSDWVKMLNVKSVDLDFSYRNFDGVYFVGMPATKGFIGTSYAVVSRLDISLLSLGRVDLLMSPALGLTYATQTFYTDHNLLIGSHLDFAGGIGFKAEVPIAKMTRLQLGVDYFHFSNTAIKLPNEGVNAISATLGIVQDIDADEKPRKTMAFNIDKKSSFEVGIGAGHRGLIQVFAQKLSPADSLKQVNATSHLNNIGFYAGYNYRLNSLLSLKAATDIIYYTTVYNFINYLTTVQEYGTSEDHFSTGISLGGDIWLGRLVFEGNYGYYLHLKYATTPIHFYYTVGAKYYLNSWVALEAKVFLHQNQAHYANFGLLFNFR